MEYKSKEELYASWWLDDLKEKGIIIKYWYESNTFILSDAVWYLYRKPLITKVKELKAELLEGHEYTPDFLVQWNKEYEGIFYRLLDKNDYTTKPPFFANTSTRDDGHYSFFEVKPNFDQNNMTRLFRITQKWMYERWKLYVDLIIMPNLFKKTFVPNRYLKTDKATTMRKINFDIRSVDEYIKWLKLKIK